MSCPILTYGTGEEPVRLSDETLHPSSWPIKFHVRAYVGTYNLLRQDSTEKNVSVR